MATTTSRKVKAMDATYYTVKDIAAQTKFYADLLGADPDVAVENMFSEWTFPGGGTFGLYKSSSNTSAGSGVLFAVDDVYATAADLKSRGVEIEEKIEDLPTCHMAFGTDPEGLFFIIHRRKDGTAG